MFLVEQAEKPGQVYSINFLMTLLMLSFKYLAHSQVVACCWGSLRFRILFYKIFLCSQTGRGRQTGRAVVITMMYVSEDVYIWPYGVWPYTININLLTLIF